MKTISMTKYTKIMDKIIADGLPVHETFIKMLEEAGKYNIKDMKLYEKKIPNKAHKKTT